jgi:hypothetical protein
MRRSIGKRLDLAGSAGEQAGRAASGSFKGLAAWRNKRAAALRSSPLDQIMIRLD